MTAPTKEQSLASDPGASVWVAASAGTGKTFVLTNRVLRILLTGVAPERILCLTFTKTAAAEMANRIHKRLGEWVVCDRPLLCEQIMGLTGKLPDAAQQELARTLFARVLDVPGGLKIQTIHSFCQSLLGRFPLEAGIAPHFQVMDDRTTAAHLNRARDAILGESQSSLNPMLAESMAHIAEKISDYSFSGLIGDLVSQRSDLEQLMRRFPVREQAAVAMAALLDLTPEDNSTTAISEFLRPEVRNMAGLRQAAQTLATGSAANQKKAATLAAFLAETDEAALVKDFDAYQKLFLTEEGTIRKSLMPKALAAADPAGCAALDEEAARLLRLADRLKRISLFENSRALLYLGCALLDAFRDSKRRHGVMDYDDLILTTGGLMNRPGIGDWILYKLDGGLDHILIDEAQDTNPEQWQVIKTLASEFFVGDSQATQTRTLFAVGDVKQSIFSFQRADPREFVQNRQMFQDKARPVAHAFHRVDLVLSFRSTAAILNLVDRVFEDPDSRMALSFSSDEISHRPSRSGDAGRVELWPVVAAPEETSEPDDWAPPVIQKPAQKPEMQLAIKIADRIADWIQKGEMLTARGRAVTPGDIMILVRRRTAFDNYMIRALKARQIPVAGQDKMLLTNQIAVMDLMAVGNFILLPGDDLTLAVVLKSPFVGISEDDLFDLAHARSGSLWAALQDRKAERPVFQAAYDFLSDLRRFSDWTPAFEFYSYLLTCLRGREKLIGRLGEEINDPIDEFLQLAMQYERDNIASLQGFLHWMDRNAVEIKRDMEQEQTQVRIMTVHAAKGLQAPVVILPDCCQMPKQGSKILWADRPDGSRMFFWSSSKKSDAGPCVTARETSTLSRDQEYLRLLYVAMTRAEDRLYITGWQGKKTRPEGNWYDRIAAALDSMAEDNYPGIHPGSEETGPAAYRWRLECPQTGLASAPPADKKEPESPAPLPAWIHRLPPAEPVPIRPLSPSKPVETEPAVSSPLTLTHHKDRDKSRFHRGRLIHRLLEILPDLPVAERAGVAHHFLSQPAHDLALDDITAITGQIMTILTNPTFADIFAPGSRAEVSLVGLVGKTPVAGQVDRLVVTDRTVMVIDYKTNRPPPQTARRIPKLYVRQMAAYRAILKDIYPDKTVISLLLWTDIAQLMPVPDAMMDQISFK